MSDFTLTLETLERLNEAHGGPRAVLLEGDTARLPDLLMTDGGWCGIRRDAATGLFSKSDAFAALGY
jgi:hypothetical protein